MISSARSVSHRPARRGFTLVEVMVALAVVALALPALMTTLAQQADNTAYLRDKTLALMVASNKLEELRLGLAQRGSMTAGRENGQTVMADRDWYWGVEITNAPDVPQMFRIDIEVDLNPLDDTTEAANSEQTLPLYRLSAFVSSDRRQSSPSTGAQGGQGEAAPDAPVSNTPDQPGGQVPPATGGVTQ